MKKILMLATAAAMLVPAFAQAETYSDAISTFGVSADVKNFCRFGDTGNTASVKTGTSSGNLSTGDQNYVVDIQNVADNTVKPANGSFNYARFVCNTPYNVVATSDNAGLKTNYVGTAPSGFLATVPYNVSFARGGVSGLTTPVASTMALVTAAAPFAGTATFKFDIPANTGLLLQGAYTDRIVLTVSPVLGVSI